jgi:SAM-dependent methyltransferase
MDEHFVPELGMNLESYLKIGHRNGVHHLIRYLWSIEVIKRYRGRIKSVLDIACGAGYGSYLIAKEFPKIQITGADYDAEAIKFAQKNYVLTNLKYIQGDAVRWDETMGSDIYECIISFDTLEHVLHREIMMQNLVNHLKRSGFLLFSTPSGGNLILQPEWEHHQLEYSAATLYDFMHRYFRTIRRPDSLPSIPCIKVFDRLEGSEVRYFLKMNPLLCKHPVHVRNPYEGEIRMKFQNYFRLFIRGKTYIRVYGLKIFLREVKTFLQK